MLKNTQTFLLVIFLSLCFTAAVNGQIYDEEVDSMMKQATSQMKKGDYNSANVTFRKLLAAKKVLPTNMSYLFAETLYMVGQYQNSENFLEKYIDLAGKGGDYYVQAIDLQKAIQSKMDEIDACSYCNVFGYRLKDCTVCDGKGSVTATCYYCKGVGKTNCLTCQGDGVIISTNLFNVNEYKSCHVCETRGHIVCKVCKGEKLIQNQCPSCLGSKRTETKILCDHQAHPPHQ